MDGDSYVHCDLRPSIPVSVPIPSISPISSIPSSSLIMSYQTLPTLPINPSFFLKLDETNYLIWREKLHVIIVYDLQFHIDSSDLIPAKIIKKMVTNITSTGHTKEPRILGFGLKWSRNFR